MTSFRWLHLTDMHCGSSADWLWPNAEDYFFEDLAKLHDLCGPWDLVLFTGDLTQNGVAGEFNKLDEFLDRLWNRLGRLCPEQRRLLAVPGNHDYRRGPSGDPNASSPFAEYLRWWAASERKPAELQEGENPGDFSVILEKDGIQLGIVGLNSAHLGKRGVSGTLFERQMERVCDDNAAAWTAERHFNILLTHHSYDDLDDDGKKALNNSIFPPGRFLLHLFGHKHQHLAANHCVNGNPEYRRWQGDALFGIENYGRPNETRHYGYSAGLLQVERKRAFLRIWPRKSTCGDCQQRWFVPAFDTFDLALDQATGAEVIEMQKEPPETSVLATDLQELMDGSARRSASHALMDDGEAYAPPLLEELVMSSGFIVELRRRALTGARIFQCYLHGIRFIDCDLTATRWQQAIVEGTDFENCPLTGIVAHDSSLLKCSLVNCELADAFFSHVTFDKVHLKGCTISNPLFLGCSIETMTFENCEFLTLSEIAFQDCSNKRMAFNSCRFPENTKAETRNLMSRAGGSVRFDSSCLFASSGGR
ncbi:MAG: hypothetical protein GY856_54365 [bacterium]|nr:hypothetical protein [bacterium]